ncbi:MAG: tRNA (adenosine(37)-N6)-dimethylallyltransferase MiaA [Alphaproteobacteria bacterium]|nr:tRNA (adenosine(37)-N6)-dimethylallyltransferase MiaA [Alphaproteobacteria bacterium]MBN2675413.1 tRNA (adenosine(37)-N6)-dimethylallyltransferase MiaA [Alphaproteobacteria bacterium]
MFIIAPMVHKSYIIAGPTASGKSDFAHELAKRVNGIIINCDSVQIYKDIENISASPFAGRNLDNTNIDGIPYKLFSVLPLTQQITVADYLDMACKEYDAAIESGKTPIFVGGSGYYIGVLLNGISPIPTISDESRTRARKIVSEHPESVRKLLPEDFIAKDPQRTARALEVFLETGRPLAEWQSLPKRGAIKPTPFKILINPHKDILKNRIADRIPKMLSGGALEEARAVIKSGWDESRAIGASELCKLLRGEITEKECNKNWITRTNQYAKRQRTWFRGQYAADLEILHIPTNADIDVLLNK